LLFEPVSNKYVVERITLTGRWVAGLPLWLVRRGAKKNKYRKCSSKDFAKEVRSSVAKLSKYSAA
jgi:hypothetical protein